MPESLIAIRVLAATLFVVAWFPISAQSDRGARVDRVAENVYVIIHQDAVVDWPSGATEWPHGNTGVIVGDDGVLVVDATYYPERARADIALIRQLTTKPVRYLINTHWHGDHTHGNGEYVAAFPGLTILGARANREYISINQERRRNYGRASASPGVDAIAHLDSLLHAGRDSTGRAFSAAELESLRVNIAQRRTELAELSKMQVAPPNVLFDDSLTVFLGSQRVELVNRGRGNSPADVTIWLPNARVLFTGDLVVMPVPYAFGTNPVPWASVLRRLEAMPVVALVPGHGAVQHDLRYLGLVRQLLETGAARAESLARRNLNAVEARKAFDISDFRGRFVTGGDATANAYWDALVPGLFDDLWACVRGSRC